MSDAAKLRIARSQDLVGLDGCIVDNGPHRHHALQVVWSRTGSASVACQGQHFTGETIVIESGEPHAVRLTDGVVALVEGHSRVAEAIRRRWLDGTRIATVPASDSRSVALQHVAALLETLATVPASEPEPEARIDAALAWLDALEQQGRWREASLEAVLRQVHLSQSRFLHLFSQRVGTPWRTYLVWRRALVAITLASRGATLTEAAHRAGYADSAHLTRQFKGLFGYVPSRALAFSQFVQG